MPREPEPSDLTCPFCGRADERSAMIEIYIELRAPSWPATPTICLNCATATYEAITRKLEALTELGGIRESSTTGDALVGLADDHSATDGGDPGQAGDTCDAGAGEPSDQPSEVGANGESAHQQPRRDEANGVIHSSTPVASRSTLPNTPRWKANCVCHPGFIGLGKRPEKAIEDLDFMIGAVGAPVEHGEKRSDVTE